MIRPLALTRQVWHTASQIQRAASLGCPWNNLPRHRNPDTPPCDYETHVYEEVNAEIGTCDSYMRTISFEDEGDVEFTVELSRGSASFMKEYPNSMLEITSVPCKTFSDIEEAMSFARSLEKQRRQWVMDHYPEHRTIQQEVLKNAPKVVIQASPKGQD